MKNVKSVEYETNNQPKIGELVRCSRDIEEGVDELFVVETTLGGRLGNKVGIKLTHRDGQPVHGREPLDSREYYFYCLCPQ